MSNKQKIFWITRTAVFVALLVVLQTVTKSMGQYVTGSLVNLVLIASTLLGGMLCGITVALLSPIFAFLLGIGPAMFPIVPAIMLGNLSIVLLWHLFAGRTQETKKTLRYVAALIVGAVTKFLVLYLSIVRLVVPIILKMPEPQATAISASFSLPQLITALIGGILALLIVPVLKKAIKPQN